MTTTVQPELPTARQRRTAAALLVVTAVITVSPVVALAMLRSGAEWLAMATLTVGTPLTFAAAVLQLAAPAVVLVLLVAAWGCLRSARWSAVLGWSGLVVAAVVLIGPLSGISLASWLPLGAFWGLLVVLACALSLVPIQRNGRPGRKGPIGFSLAAFVTVVGVIGVIAGGQLPGSPKWFHGETFRLGEGTPEVFAAPSDPQNQAMARFPFAGIHNDAAQTDTYPESLRIDPARVHLRTFTAGGGCASIAWDSDGDIATICVSDAVTAYLLDGDDLTEIARYRISDRPLTTDFLTDFGGGGYMYLSDDDAIVTTTLNRSVLVLDKVTDDSSAGAGITLQPRVEYDLGGALLDDETPTSVLPDSSGRMWFVGQLGTVGYINPNNGAIVSRQWEGENIENSFATGATDDVYVVTSTALRRLSAGDNEIVVEWESTYDTGSRRKPGQTSRASGTTPTLHGKDWVSIADNGEVMAVDVFRRSDGVRVCHTPVFDAGRGATENTLVAVGDDLLVENNYGYTLFDVIGGHSTEAGLARVEVGADGDCEVAWTNTDVRIPSVVSKSSAAGGFALTYSKDRTWWGSDRWWITAIGLADGDILWQRLAGVGSARNNHYAAIYMSPEGEVFVGTVMGIVAMVPPE